MFAFLLGSHDSCWGLYLPNLSCIAQVQAGSELQSQLGLWIHSPGFLLFIKWHRTEKTFEVSHVSSSWFPALSIFLPWFPLSTLVLLLLWLCYYPPPTLWFKITITSNLLMTLESRQASARTACFSSTHFCLGWLNGRAWRLAQTSGTWSEKLEQLGTRTDGDPWSSLQVFVWFIQHGGFRVVRLLTAQQSEDTHLKKEPRRNPISLYDLAPKSCSISSALDRSTVKALPCSRAKSMEYGQPQMCKKNTWDIIYFGAVIFGKFNPPPQTFWLM